MDVGTILRQYAEQYNDDKYFVKDPIIFPKHFAKLLPSGDASLQDVEVAAVISAHLAWGRRDMIVRDCTRAMEEMCWKPFDYVCSGEYRNENVSLHRTIKWSEFALICSRLKQYYELHESLEELSPNQFRSIIYGQKSDESAANKKIHMLRRWMVRDDSKVDLGLWKKIDKGSLIIPLDVHVHRSSLALGLTKRNCVNFKTSWEITQALCKIFPGDPVVGDFALFAYAAAGHLYDKSE